ncbi:hypothetical protein Pmar_PMAR003739 [Perkinsus marinus ATCC 50983]|uniref:Uncharacterized protein n=2 Tax=Perkinsus marinus (strain ATCC 50983 / TXsc) TaxID=423536 RepID=C5KI63_PERM5|nr:hypothetical protein Pmar_PMAR003739 [Perkinsus marinus ATCC 50983]EER16275.1 hypothetical protein Pmar_PMAR003739 [Perkinsus marinus ATCC 50983]|eukprot:XP_002784479.1 hypothetical protein Pmar_PMAR003739 [Perkinsus marinus ATCC 50983]
MSQKADIVWTGILGGVLSLGYIQWRQHFLSENLDKKSYFDEFGNKIEFEDEQDAVEPTVSNPMKRAVAGLKAVYTPHILDLAALVSAVWGYRAFKNMNKLLERRYADITYQIRRPDVLLNRIVSLKYLVYGGVLIPVLAGGSLALAQWLTLPVEERGKTWTSRVQGTVVGDYLTAAQRTIGQSIVGQKTIRASSDFQDFAHRMRDLGDIRSGLGPWKL